MFSVKKSPVYQKTEPINIKKKQQENFEESSSSDDDTLSDTFSEEKVNKKTDSKREVNSASTKGIVGSSSLKHNTKLSSLSEDEKKLRHKEQMKKWREEHESYNKSYRQKYYAENREKILGKRRETRIEEKKLLEEFKKYKEEQAKKTFLEKK
jgi:hypothetical protein